MRRGQARAEQGAQIDEALRAMFQSLNDRPIPDRILSLIDQLDDGEVAPVKRPQLRIVHA